MRLFNDRHGILAIALPAIVTNITTPLLALLDVAVTGHMGSPVYIAAIALGGTIFNMVYWLFGFLRMGTSGMTAQSFGRDDRSGATAVLRRGLAVALIAGIVIAALSPLEFEAAIRLMDADEAVYAPTKTYFMICVWGAPAVLATFAMTGWLLGMQDSKACMWVSLTVNVVNIVASLTLVYGFGLGIAGVAIGTLSAQWTGALMAMRLCVSHGAFRRVAARGAAAAIGGLGSFFKVNAFIFLRTLCLVAVTVWFTRAGSMQGTVMLAVNTLLMQLFVLFSYFMDGFAYAGEALAGKYVGMGDSRSLRACVKHLMWWGVAMATVFAVLWFIGGQWVLAVLSDDGAVVAAALDYLPWSVVIPFVGMAAFVWDGVYIGATATAQMALAMATAMAVYFAAWWLLYPLLGNHGLWIAFCLYLATRSAMQTVMARRVLSLRR